MFITGFARTGKSGKASIVASGMTTPKPPFYTQFKFYGILTALAAAAILIVYGLTR